MYEYKIRIFNKLNVIFKETLKIYMKTLKHTGR